MTLERPFLLFGKPDIGELEEEFVLRVLRSGWLGNGPVCKELEKLFSKAVSRFHEFKAVAVNSCTMGLFLALKASGIKAGDHVVTTPLTFAATVNAILMAGAKPVFADVNDSGCIDPIEVSEKITPKTQAMIPVHLAGVPCDMDSLVSIGKNMGFTVIEDCAHGIGGTYKGYELGTLGDYGVFSFYPTKNIASGDGGMVVSRNQGGIDAIRLLASQGVSASAWERYGASPVKDYEVSVPGFKGLMSDVHAAIALAQVHRWKELSDKRNTVWQVYEDAFGKKEDGHAKHLFSLRFKNRDQIRTALKEKGIGTGVHYRPLHLEPAYASLGYRMGDFPIAEKIGEETLSLPVSPTMSKEDAEFVVQSVKEIGEGNRGV